MDIDKVRLPKARVSREEIEERIAFWTEPVSRAVWTGFSVGETVERSTLMEK